MMGTSRLASTRSATDATRQSRAAFGTGSAGLLPRLLPWRWVERCCSTVVAWRRRRPSSSSFQFSAPGSSFTNLAVDFAVSPDGRHVAFIANSKAGSSLWVRSLAAVDVRQIRGTDGARNPFWSPDSQSIGFFAGNQLKTVKATGEAAVVPLNGPCPCPRLGDSGWPRRNLEQPGHRRLRAIQRRQPVSNRREARRNADAGHCASTTLRRPCIGGPRSFRTVNISCTRRSWDEKRAAGGIADDAATRL